jgi:hypothetical protein
VPRLIAPVLVVVSQALAAQAPGSVAHAVSSITPTEVRQRISVLADDSMRGRDTPSPELDKVAAWIAAEFRRFGLRPGGDSGTYLQRYPIGDERRDAVDPTATLLTVTRAGYGSVTLTARDELRLLRVEPVLPSRDVSGPIVLLSGAGAAAPLGAGALAGAWLAELGTALPDGLHFDGRAAREAFAAGAVGLLIISDRSGATGAPAASDALPAAVDLGPPRSASALPPGAVEIPERTAGDLLGVDPRRLRAPHARTLERLEGLTLRLHVTRLAAPTAPNVIGILEGSDPRLRGEYVLFTAHMDHLGVASPRNPACRARGGDSICNGADDDASGTAAVLACAQAFAQLMPPPRRSLVFLTVSGEEKGLWGSTYFTEHPTVPLAAVVADLNSDMIGRNWRDTIAAIGKEQSDLGTTLDRVAAAHPELHMTPIGDIWPTEHFYTRSDHYNFARHGIPILFFFNGTHADYHEVSDEVQKIDAEKEARIIKLLFYLGLEIANAPERPRWNPESYKRVVDGAN